MLGERDLSVHSTGAAPRGSALRHHQRKGFSLDHSHRDPVSRRAFLLATAAGSALPFLAMGDAARAADAAPRPAGARLLTVIQGADADTLDPTNEIQMYNETIIAGMCEKLLLPSKTRPGQFDPLLATSWTPVGDTKWRLTLRQGVKFHNGAPFNAAAAKWSLDHFFAKALSRSMFRGVSRVDVVDEHTIDLITAAPNGLIPSYLSGLAFMLEPGWMTSADYSPNKVVGTGPYRFVEWSKGQHLTMEAFPDYWGGAPAFQTVRWQPIAEGSTRLAALLSGEADIVRQIPPQDVPVVKSHAGTRIVTSPSSRTFMIRIRNDIPPFNDPRVRLALNLAVNVNAIIAAIMRGFAVPLQGQTVGQDVTGWDPDTKAFPYDPERAKALLAEAGVKPGLQVKLDTTAERWGNDLGVCTAVAGELQKVGLKVEVVINESGEYTDKLAGKKEFAPLFIRSSGNIVPDIENGVNDMVRIPPSTSRFHSDRLEDMYTKLQGTADPAARQVLAKQVAQTMQAEIPAILLFNYSDIYGIRDRVSWTPRFNQWILMNEVAYSGKQGGD